MEVLLFPVRLTISPQNLWLWIACSVLLSALINGLIWRLRRSSLASWPGWALGVLSLLGQGGRFLYFVGLPYVALLGGLMPTTKVGLVSRNWAADLTLILPLSLGATLVLMLLRLLTAWREGAAFDIAESRQTLLPLGLRLRESLYREVHWAFYRSAPLLAVERREMGIALGVGIVALEAGLDPAWRSRWRDPDRALLVWRESTLAVLMAVVFGVTGNWWVTVAVHLIVEAVSGWIWSRAEVFSTAVA